MKIKTFFVDFDSNYNRISNKRILLTYLKNLISTKNILTVSNFLLLCIAFYHHGKEINDRKIARFVNHLDSIQPVLEDQQTHSRIFKREIILDDKDPNKLFNNFYFAKHQQSQKFQMHSVINPFQFSPQAGVTYIRWGRKVCDGNEYSMLLYQGIAAGAKSSHTGGGSNILCLVNGINYANGKYVDGFQSSSYIYGLEYGESSLTERLFDSSHVHSGRILYQSVPCAVCVAKESVAQVMIPGQLKCPAKWKKEYTGYIMSAAHSSNHSSSFLCVDDKPEVVYGSQESKGGGTLFMVEAQCPSLQCTPYVDGRELSCVVCTIGL